MIDSPHATAVLERQRTMIMDLKLKGGASVPSVKTVTRRMITIAGGPLGAPGIEDLEIVSSKTGSTGAPDMVGYTLIGTCGAVHGPLSGLWTGEQPGGNPACGVGFTPQEDFQTAYKKANLVTSTTGTMQRLSTMNGIVPGTKRRRETWNRPAGTRSKVRAGLASPQHSLGPTPTAEDDRQMRTDRRVRRQVALAPYMREATELSVSSDGKGNMRFDGPPVKVIHREVPTKKRDEKKANKKVGALIGAYHKLTEINDLVDALAEGIPDKRCSNLPGFRKLVCVVNNWDAIDPFNAGVALLVNEIEDRIVGRLQGRLSDALKSAGGPNSTQVQQFVRQLKMMGVI